MSILNQTIADIDGTIGTQGTCRCEGGIFATIVIDLSGYDLNNDITIDSATGLITGITVQPDTAVRFNHPSTDLVTGSVTSEAVSEFSTRVNETATYSWEVPPTCNSIARAEDIIYGTCDKLVIHYLNCGDCCEAIVEGLKVKNICGNIERKTNLIQFTKDFQIGDNTGNTEATRQWTMTTRRQCSELFTNLALSAFDAALV